MLGDEPHLAYNRVGLTSFFNHRKIENLYLNPAEWVCRPLRPYSNVFLTTPFSTHKYLRGLWVTM